jgi:hypothetical protein
MLRRPFAFWLPAFILAFLLWAWGLSCYQSFRLTHWSQEEERSRLIQLDFGASQLAATVAKSSADKIRRPSNSDTRFVREEFPPTHSHWWFPLPGIEHRDESIPGIQSHLYRILIPCWLIVLLYLGLWRLAVHRYDRRTRRLRSKDLPSSGTAAVPFGN